MDGLHGMKATISRLIVIISVRQPIRAEARAASQPAWPAPMTHYVIAASIITHM
ncbi:hypothetical protein D3C75_588140 [compost metagenome]